MYPYTDGAGIGIYDFNKGWSEGRPVGQEEFVIGSDSRIERFAGGKLEQIGIQLPGDSSYGFKQYLPDGLQFRGEQYPAVARMYVNYFGKPFRKENLVLIYAHYEKRCFSRWRGGGHSLP